MAASPFSGLKASFDSQLAKLSQNERRLLGLMSLIVPVGALVLAFNFWGDAKQINGEARIELEDAQQAARRGTGGSLAADLQKTREQVREWSWQGNTVAVAQVRAQSQVADLAALAGLYNAEVKTNEHFEVAGDVTLAPIEVTAPFSWPALSEFMSGLSATGKGFVLEQVQMTADKEPKIRISLKVPLIVTEPVQPKAQVKARST